MAKIENLLEGGAVAGLVLAVFAAFYFGVVVGSGERQGGAVGFKIETSNSELYYYADGWVEYNAGRVYVRATGAVFSSLLEVSSCG